MAFKRRGEVRPHRDSKAGECRLKQCDVRLSPSDHDPDLVPWAARAMVFQNSPGKLDNLVVLGGRANQNSARRGPHGLKPPNCEARPAQGDQPAARRARPRRQTHRNVASLTVRIDKIQFSSAQTRESVPVERAHPGQGPVAQSLGRAAQPLMTRDESTRSEPLLNFNPHAA